MAHNSIHVFHEAYSAEEGVHEGDICNSLLLADVDSAGIVHTMKKCDGTLELVPQKDCLCHLGRAPCHYCENRILQCDECGRTHSSWEEAMRKTELELLHQPKPHVVPIDVDF